MQYETTDKKLQKKTNDRNTMLITGCIHVFTANFVNTYHALPHDIMTSSTQSMSQFTCNSKNDKL